MLLNVLSDKYHAGYQDLHRGTYSQLIAVMFPFTVLFELSFIGESP